jgi:hypothetical protein
MISTPLVFPRVFPSNWDDWWAVWHKESKLLKKTKTNHNTSFAPWWGLDIFVAENTDPGEVTHYTAPLISNNDLFNELIINLNMLPIDVKVVRAVSSQTAISPHSDSNSEILSVRSLIYDNNIYPTFYYLFDDKKSYQQLPDDTNTWAYWDHRCMHGTDYYRGHSKILLMYYGNIKKDTTLTDSITKYQEFIIR